MVKRTRRELERTRMRLGRTGYTTRSEDTLLRYVLSRIGRRAVFRKNTKAVHWSEMDRKMNRGTTLIPINVVHMRAVLRDFLCTEGLNGAPSPFFNANAIGRVLSSKAFAIVEGRVFTRGYLDKFPTDALVFLLELVHPSVLLVTLFEAISARTTDHDGLLLKRRLRDWAHCGNDRGEKPEDVIIFEALGNTGPLFDPVFAWAVGQFGYPYGALGGFDRETLHDIMRLQPPEEEEVDGSVRLEEGSRIHAILGQVQRDIAINKNSVPRKWIVRLFEEADFWGDDVPLCTLDYLEGYDFSSRKWAIDFERIGNMKLARAAYNRGWQTFDALLSSTTGEYGIAPQIRDMVEKDASGTKPANRAHPRPLDVEGLSGTGHE